MIHQAIPKRMKVNKMPRHTEVRKENTSYNKANDKESKKNENWPAFFAVL